MEEKLVNGSSSDVLEQHCISELFDAVENKDHAAFRKALEALIMNMFEDEEHEDAAGTRKE